MQKKISQQQLVDTAYQVTDFFRRQKIPFMLIGGLACAYWRYTRATLDVDFMLQLHFESMDRLKHLLRENGFDINEEWAEQNPLLNRKCIRARINDVVIDILLPSDEHDENALRRRKLRSAGARNFWVTSPEDLILQKIKAQRLKDYTDAIQIYQANKKKLDLAYLRKWAKKIGVYEELNTVFAAPQEWEPPPRMP